MRSALLLAALLLRPGDCTAQETAAFLKIGIGARAMGMGGAYTAVADGADAASWNPAGLAGLSQRELGFMHAQLAADARLDAIAFAQPMRFGALGVGAARLGQGAIEGRDEAGRPAGGYSATDETVGLSGAAQVLPGVHLGAGVRYVQSGIADASARTFAADLGGMYALSRMGPGVPRLGFAVRNLGPGMRFLDARYDLPLTLAAGAAYLLPAGVVVAAEYSNRPYSASHEFALGTEYAVLPAAALRFGYASALAAPRGGSGALQRLGGLNGLGAGIGLRFSRYTFDYAVRPMAEMGNTQELSMGARF